MVMITSIGKNSFDLETELQKTSVKLFKWFYENGMKANQDKFHYLSCLEFSLPACILDNSGSQKLLDVTIDRKLDFN